MRRARVLTTTLIAIGLTASSIGATAAQEPNISTEPAWVSGIITFATSCDKTEGGFSCSPQLWQTDDERLSGDAISIWNADEYDVDGQTYSVTSSFIEIRGTTGGFVCISPDGLELGSGLFTEAIQGTDRLSCEGIGNNTGLSAILVVDYRQVPRTVEGLIFPGDVAPVPASPIGA